MNKAWNSFRLRIPKHRETGKAANTNHCFRPKCIHNPSDLKKTFYQFEWQADIFYQRTSVEPRNINPFYLESCLWNLFHFHFPFCAYEQDFKSTINLFQCIGNRNCRENMSTRSSSCYDDPLIQFLKCSMLIFHCSFETTSFLPSNCSTFLATLRMIPIARQVNKKELPPILTSGKVTPVTGNKFTFTAIFTSAWITKVKLNPNARKAPKA